MLFYYSLFYIRIRKKKYRKSKFQNSSIKIFTKDTYTRVARVPQNTRERERGRDEKKDERHP